MCYIKTESNLARIFIGSLLALFSTTVTTYLKLTILMATNAITTLVTWNGSLLEKTMTTQFNTNYTNVEKIARYQNSLLMTLDTYVRTASNSIANLESNQWLRLLEYLAPPSEKS